MEPFLPDDDPDLTLAQRLGTGAGIPPGGEDAALLLRLAAYRDATQAAPGEARSTQIWEAVAAKTRPAARIHRMPGWTRWAAAAALFAGAALVAFWMRPEEQLFYAVAPGTAPQTTTLPDGSTVTLRPGSSLRQVDDARYRLQGEAFFAVAHDPSRTFEVEAGVAVVQVLGTRFDVRVVDDEVEVFLEEGRVRFAAGDSAVVLAPGQRSFLADGVPAAPQVAPSATALDWIDGHLVFDGQPLAHVAREIELHYDLRLVLPAAQQAETVTGTLVLGDAGETLDRLARVAGGRFEQMDDRTYRLVVE